MPLREPELLAHARHRQPPLLRAEFHRATSCRICFASDSSAANSLGREFSRSSSFNRLACSSFSPPYSFLARGLINYYYAAVVLGRSLREPWNKYQMISIS